MVQGNTQQKARIRSVCKFAVLAFAFAAVLCTVSLSLHASPLDAVVWSDLSLIAALPTVLPNNVSSAEPSTILRKNWTVSCPLTVSRALQMPPLNFRVHTFSDTLVVSPSTVVTGYFRIESKHPSERYDEWIPNMLSTLDPLVVFTETAWVETVRKNRQHALNATVIVELTLQDMPITQVCTDKLPSPELFWQNEHDMDPEGPYHKSYKLYWIWLSKTWWVSQAIQMNFFQSDFFMYTDIGCYRQTYFNNKQVVRHSELVPEGTVLFMAHHKTEPPPALLYNKKLDQNGHYATHFYHSGSQGAGSLKGWQNFHQSFAMTLDAFIQHKLFVGEDQMVMQSTCMMEPHLCSYAPYEQVRDDHYYGIRHVMHHGGKYDFWHPPSRAEGGRNLTV
jgi:hypothetical protein